LSHALLLPQETRNSKDCRALRCGEPLPPQSRQRLHGMSKIHQDPLPHMVADVLFADRCLQNDSMQRPLMRRLSKFAVVASRESRRQTIVAALEGRFSTKTATPQDMTP